MKSDRPKYLRVFVCAFFGTMILFKVVMLAHAFLSSDADKKIEPIELDCSNFKSEFECLGLRGSIYE